MTDNNPRRALAWSVLLAVFAGFMAATEFAGMVVADELPAIVPGLTVHPASVRLIHPRRPLSLTVRGTLVDGRTRDLSGEAKFQTANPAVARVSSLGWIEPVANGTTDVLILFGGQLVSVKVEVALPVAAPAYSFKHDVMPALSKGGCNTGACHGYSLGKNGFKLSLRGADPPADYLSLADEFFERRVNRRQPEASLVLTKPLGDVPHKGGVRFERESLEYDLIAGWIRDGALDDLQDPVQIEAIRLYPPLAVVPPRTTHQLQLIARYSDGSERDVTRLGIFTANQEEIAAVDSEGLVTIRALGETAIVARFERIFATSNFLVLEPRADFVPTPVPQDHLVDRAVVEKLNALHIRPTGPVDDERFLRRVTLDLIGIQPSPTEIAAFLADPSPDKRTRWIDALLAREEYVDRWSLKWGDLLQNSRKNLSESAMYAFREWIRAAIAENRPFDQFVRELLSGSGAPEDDPTAAFFAISKDADDTLQRATQVFCGVRMLCARCHPHPHENWTQVDYYGLHSFFNQIGVKPDQRFPGVPNAKSVTINFAAGYSTNPRTGQAQPPRFLGGAEPEVAPATDRREVYARWLTSPENPHFARSVVNRYWSYFFHRGIIDPVDDLRTTNPPINPALLEALTAEFVAHKFDVKHLVRTIVTSAAYQRDGVTNETNAHDDANFSRFIPRRLPAESLLDSLVQATGIRENVGGAPAGFSANQLPDGDVQSDFLGLFGKPSRAEACECERDDGSNMLQALQLINGPTLLARISNPSGRLMQLTRQHAENAPLVEQIYLWSLARKPREPELALAVEFLIANAARREEAAGDLMWALFNSRDFLLVH